MRRAKASTTAMRRFDDECRSAVAENLQLRGVHVHPECNPTRIEKEGEGRYVLHYRDGGGQEQSLRCGKVMMATGRRANTRGIGLEVRRKRVQGSCEKMTGCSSGEPLHP